MYQHRKSYESERTYRWDLAGDQEEPTIRRFCSYLALLGYTPTFARLDVVWNDVFPFKTYNFSRGCPDYLVQLEKDSYLYVEIKIKDQEFRKTITGGRTKQGSLLPAYGCSSYYLDKIPVCQNIHRWQSYAEADPRSVVLLFSNDTEQRYMNLQELDILLDHGWHETPITEFGEGYGRQTYLLPKDATTTMSDLTKVQLLSLSSAHLCLPDDSSLIDWMIL